MSAVYRVQVDFDDDGAFDSADEDLSADVLALEWSLGLAAPFDSVAGPSAAQITLRSFDRRYAPESGLPLTPGRRLRISSQLDGQTRAHFSGAVAAVEPMPGALGQRLAVIHAVGVDDALARALMRLPPLLNQTADAAIAAVLDAVPFRSAALAGRWLLNVPGYSELGSSARLLNGVYPPRGLQSGRSTFAYMADTWGAGITAQAAIAQAAEAERGRFYADREGRLVFLNRHHMLQQTAASAVFADSMDGLRYVYGAEVVNRVRVTAAPRQPGLPGTTLWTLARPVAIQPGEAAALRLVAPYRDQTGRRMGALAVLPPAAGFDYQANTRADGSGSDRTASVTLRDLTADGGAAAFTVVNHSGEKVYLLAGARLRGTPLLPADPLLIEQRDPVSAVFYGDRSMQLDLPALDSVDEADQLARYELARRSRPRGCVRQLTLSGAAHLPQMLARTLFDRIRISETQTGHSADYFIIHEAHQVSGGGFRHQVTWRLEPAAASAFWGLDQTPLNTSSVLAY